MNLTDERVVPAGAPAGTGRRVASALQGVVIAIGFVMLVVGFAVLALNFRPYRVPTASMSPTVRVGDTVVAKRVDGGAVGRGDIVVFRDSAWGNAVLVKRVVAVGGDTVACCDARQRLIVNGTALDEPYTAEGSKAGPGAAFSVTVPSGRLFLLGDQRSNSLDSRSHLDVQNGTVPSSDVLGRVEGTVWPSSRMGLLGRTAAFETLGAPRSSDSGLLEPAALTTVAGAVLIVVASVLGWLVALACSARRRRS